MANTVPQISFRVTPGLKEKWEDALHRARIDQTAALTQFIEQFADGKIPTVRIEPALPRNAGDLHAALDFILKTGKKERTDLVSASLRSLAELVRVDLAGSNASSAPVPILRPGGVSCPQKAA